MIQHEVHDDANPAPAGFLHETIEVLHRAEPRINTAIVGDIVSEVAHGRGIDRRQPDCIDPQRIWGAIVEIIKSRNDAGEVTDPIAVGVLETPRIDLVNNGGFPPAFTLTYARGSKHN